MLARRVPMLFASLAIVAVTQAPVPAHAESWSIFDWLRPAPQSTVDPQVAPAPRPQRVATVIPEARKPAPRMIVIGVGF
jgi:hypothetical protein